MKFLLRLLTFTLFFCAPWAVFGQDEDRFSEAELHQMLAPIALYPDALLAQILTASTYPLEIVEASRWVQERGLEGEDAVEAADAEEWDPSVKALVAFPDVLARMDEDLEWTQQLGEAVLLQQEEVMATVQKLREKAHTAGNLRSLENVEVRREKEIIYIEPANPQIVYVPYYQPTVVYGTWGWPTHPPVYWRPFTSVSIRTGSTHIIWTRGYRFSHRYYYSRPDWHKRHIVVHHHYHKRPQHVHRSGRDWRKYSSGERWQHRSEHRRGVRYRSPTLREQFAKRHHPGREHLTRGDRIDLRRQQVREAQKQRERRDGSTQSVTPPQQRDLSNLQRLARERRQERTRPDVGSSERRENARQNQNPSSEQIRQRLIRDRAQQQRRAEQANTQRRAEQANTQRRVQPPTNIERMQSRNSRNERNRAPQVGNRDERRTHQRASGIRQSRPQVQQPSQRPSRQERRAQQPQSQQRQERAQQRQRAPRQERSANPLMRGTSVGNSNGESTRAPGIGRSDRR